MSNQTYLNITNEQLLLINILNTIYNDNLRQINLEACAKRKLFSY